ncbi:membrane or secreted protein [Zunongwangia sp.]|uniref:membrane or secreted protein n=1 Tax=Zunongwangia sp. TaxID=1965325 RepID=UPI003AA7F07D
MELFIITAVLLGLAFAGIAIKIWAKKDGEFAGTCASQSPFLNKEGEACSFCGKGPDEKCKSPKQQTTN